MPFESTALEYFPKKDIDILYAGGKTQPSMTTIAHRTALLVFVCLLAAAVHPGGPRAQEPLSYSESLLWRLQHPSGNHGYIFGTLHSPDRRLIPFVDYLRSYIEDADVVYFEQTLRDLETTYYAAQPLVDEPLRNRLEPALYDRVTSYFDRLAWWLEYEPIFHIEGWITQEHTTEDILDTRLERVAMRHGVPRSLETTEERLRLVQITEQLDANDIIASAFHFSDAYPDAWDEAVERYIAMDLNWFMDTTGYACDETTDADWCDTMDAYEAAWQEDIVLRDRAMASRIEAAIEATTENQSIFVAVGAAHLPGHDGILALLVDKGFSVTPVPILLPRNDLTPVILVVAAVGLASFAVFRIVAVRRRAERRRIAEAQAERVEKWHAVLDRPSDRR